VVQPLLIASLSARQPFQELPASPAATPCAFQSLCDPGSYSF
jgi:hypothetical protein